MNMVIVDQVVDLCLHGLTPVRLHFPIIDNESTRCSCGNPQCPENSRGKHPVEKAWGKSATTDLDVVRERWGDKPWNVGIILGVCHGIPSTQAIIDIEDDSPEGRDFAETLLGEFPSPSYTSGKSIHRLYRWSEKLPAVANMTLNGLEFRFGGKGLETQSVAPPSMHRTGIRYAWIDGRSLNDIEIPELPDHVVEYLNEEYTRQESGRSTNSSSGTAKFRKPSGKIGPGSRHHSLLKYANSLWRMAFEFKGINGLEEQEVIDQTWMFLAGQNALVCDPPKSEAELEVIFRSSQQFMRSEIEKELEEKLQKKLTEQAEQPCNLDVDSFGAYLQKNGIFVRHDPMIPLLDKSPDRIDEWRCNWKISYLVKGDEETMEIFVDGIDKPIQMTVAEFESHTYASRRIQQETKGRIVLNKTFTYWDWKSIWDGRKNDSKGKEGITRGLKEFLRNSSAVRSRDENSLTEQVEDIIGKLCGPKNSLVEAMDAWKNSGHKFTGRLKFAPGTTELTTISLPDDPSTGFYAFDDEVLLLVKFSELTGAYRRSFGGGVSTRHLTEAMGEIGYERKKIFKNKIEGRWYVLKIQ